MHIHFTFIFSLNPMHDGAYLLCNYSFFTAQKSTCHSQPPFILRKAFDTAQPSGRKSRVAEIVRLNRNVEDGALWVSVQD